MLENKTNTEPDRTPEDRRAINLRTKSREVAKAIRRFIEDGIQSGEFGPGDKLPTERELAWRFGGGRNTVRRILVAMEEEGKIVRHVGRGTFISEQAVPAPEAASLPLSEISQLSSPAELMELRLALEPVLADLAVQRASQREIETMLRCLEEARQARNLQEFEHWDDVLHRTIAEASRNTLFVKVYEMISAVRYQGEWERLKERSLSPEQREFHMSEHQRIVEAIRSRDALRARQEMESHLRHIQAGMFGRRSGTPIIP